MQKIAAKMMPVCKNGVLLMGKVSRMLAFVAYANLKFSITVHNSFLIIYNNEHFCQREGGGGVCAVSSAK